MLKFYHFSKFQSYPSLKHIVSKKSKKLPYHFSLALHTGETKEVIIANRKALAQSLGSHNIYFIVANQTHSDNIHVVTNKKTQGWQSIDDAIENCDALITQQINVVLTVLTADCVPILLYDPIEHVIAAVHAGWKGTQANIVAKTIEKMHNVFGSKPENIIAGIAPSIGKCCYEVGTDVAMHFSGIPNAYINAKDKYMLDLPHINRLQLLNAGLLLEHIEMSNICTACNIEEFFSYRKEKGCSGRFMSMIMLKEKV